MVAAVVLWIGLTTITMGDTQEATAQRNFAFLSYEKTPGVLHMTLVSPSTHGNVLLASGQRVTKLSGAVFEGLFSLVVPVSCEQLQQPSQLIWQARDLPPIIATIPAQTCTPDKPVQPPVQIFFEKNVCWIDTQGNTLWRAGVELGKLNNATVYQNMYGLYLLNRSSFRGEDITRLHARRLACPTDQILQELDPVHVKQLFKDALEFSKQGKAQ
ncbi:hypothetical protein ACW5XW_20415 [Aeromonas piscicola]|uniref:hypothetical protein n=1 Tax=Aeromonas piscicola TaxID=600645 RepID=UPI0012E0A392|nr:hypothetical protein [Aeromonas piscicola]